MGCLKLNTDENIRDKFKMCDKNTKEKKNFSFGNYQLWELAKTNGGIITIIIAVITGVVWLSNSFSTINENVNNLSEDITEINSEIDEIVEEQKVVHKYLYEDEGVQDQLGMINEALHIKVINVTEESTMSFIEDVTIIGNDISATTSAFSSESKIGVDAKGNVYIAKELIGETILLTYRDEGKDIFFLGQYNEDYLWDGYCVTNAYNTDGTLYGICESEFRDGVRQSYKTVLSVGLGKWDYYERECISGSDGEDNNIGISASYESSYGKIADFTKSNVRISDILYVSDFVDNENKILKQYYSGCTSKKKYNDTSGNAYLIKFDDDGTVNTLYVGQFVNGKLKDSTGNAWNIVYSKNDGYYVCNTGMFTDNHAIDYADEPFSQEDIDKKIEGYNFDCELNWKTID